MKRVHYTDSYLMSPQHPVTVNLIGAGGTGSQVLTCLARLDTALRGLGHPGLFVTLYDPDTVTEANIGRQLFGPSDLGQNKAQCLVTRINNFFGNDWKAQADIYPAVLKDTRRDNLANITITCTDNIKSRIDLWNLLRALPQPTYCTYETPLYWMDFGNTQTTGQVVLGTVPKKIKQPASKLYETVNSLKVITRMVKYARVKETDSGPSCSLAEALERQDLFITGAGRAVLKDGSCGSIGYGIATAYAKEGANLVITGRNVKKLEAAKQELESLYGIKVLTVQADVCAGGDNEATVANVVKQAVDTFGGIQVLINNAQASASGVPLAEHTTEQFDLAIYSGLYAAFYYMKACYPYLAESHGSVINFASGAGLFGNFGQSAYAAAKEGIRGMSRVAATEWGKDGINVNVVCPLAWTAKLEQFRDAYPDAFKANVKMPPMGHYGNAETEIGRVCVQLAMPDFKYMSGETLTLEGGMGQRP